MGYETSEKGGRQSISAARSSIPCFSKSNVVKCLARNIRGNGNNDDTPIKTISVLGP